MTLVVKCDVKQYKQASKQASKLMHTVQLCHNLDFVRGSTPHEDSWDNQKDKPQDEDTSLTKYVALWHIDTPQET